MKKRNIKTIIKDLDKADPSKLVLEDQEAILEAIKNGASAEDAVAGVYEEVYRPVALQNEEDRQTARYLVDQFEVDEKNHAAAEAQIAQAKVMAAQMADLADQRDEKIKEYVETMYGFASRVASISEDDFENGFAAGDYTFRQNFFDEEIPIGTLLENDADNIYSLMRMGYDKKDAVVLVWSRTYADVYDKVYTGAQSKNAAVRAENQEKKNRLLTYYKSMEAYAGQMQKELAPYLDKIKEYSEPIVDEPEGELHLTQAALAIIHRYEEQVDYMAMTAKAMQVYDQLKAEKGDALRLEDFLLAANTALDMVPEEARAVYAKGLYIGLKSGEIQKADAEFKRTHADELGLEGEVGATADEADTDAAASDPDLITVSGETEGLDSSLEVPLAMPEGDFVDVLDSLSRPIPEEEVEAEEGLEGAEVLGDGIGPVADADLPEAEPEEVISSAEVAEIYGTFNTIEKKWLAENLHLDTPEKVAAYVKESGGAALVKGALKLCLKAEERESRKAAKKGELGD